MSLSETRDTKLSLIMLAKQLIKRKHQQDVLSVANKLTEDSPAAECLCKLRLSLWLTSLACQGRAPEPLQIPLLYSMLNPSS